MSSSDEECPTTGKRRKGIRHEDQYKRNVIKKSKLMGKEHVNWVGKTVPVKKPASNFCRKLSLSTNMIEKISGISTLKNLRILSVGRNYIKSFAGLEPLGDTLEELWISYNLIEKIKTANFFKKLRVLYMSNNVVREWSEFSKLQEIPNLEELLFVGNPLCDTVEEGAWKAEAIKKLPNLRKLDGEPVIREETVPEQS